MPAWSKKKGDPTAEAGESPLSRFTFHNHGDRSMRRGLKIHKTLGNLGELAVGLFFFIE